MSKFIALLLSFVLCGCSVVRTLPETSAAVDLKTLSSAIALTLRTADQAISGSGYLVYRKPDKTHIVVLSPFGTTLFEGFTLGEQIILAYPSEKLAFAGNFNELPEKGGMINWQSIHWILEDAGFQSKPTNKDSIVDNGFVSQKNRSGGATVYYANRIPVNGVLLAHEYDLRNSNGDQLRIVLEEPEVNGILDESVFMPRLEGFKVYPLKALEQ